MNRLESLGNLNGIGSGFERISSVDGLVGGIFRELSGQAGMNRSESENAFQEFLKKIPSASNLTSIGAAAQQAGAEAGTAALANAAEGGGEGGGGMPRVPSLDFLRALVVNQQQQQQQQPNPWPVKLEPGLPVQGSNGTAPSLGLSWPVLDNTQELSTQLQQANGGGLKGLSNMGGNAATSSAPASSDGGRSGIDVDDKAEARRARRMLSNRESARRSRRRKQEHLSKLEDELNAAENSKKAVHELLANLERRLASAEEENRSLRDENEQLKDELRFLRKEISDRRRE